MHRVRAAGLIAALVGSLTSVGQAQPVTYNTLTTQLCFGGFGCGTNQQTIGGATGINVLFQPIASSTVNPNPASFGSFGELIVSCVGGGTACGMQSLTGLNLFIVVNQVAPTAGSATLLAGALSGNVSGTMSSASILWPNPNAVQIGAIRYAVLNNPLGIVPPSTNGGLTSIQASITNTVIPEPSAFVLLAMGLLGLVVLPRRRKGA